MRSTFGMSILKFDIHKHGNESYQIQVEYTPSKLYPNISSHITPSTRLIGVSMVFM